MKPRSFGAFPRLLTLVFLITLSLPALAQQLGHYIGGFTGH